MTFDATNPFANRSTLPFELPPFADIKDEHYLPAFYAGTAAHLSEIDHILGSGEPTFENTIVALEKSGLLLGRMLMVFYNKSSSDTSDAVDAIEAEIAPKLSAHQDAINLNPALFERIERLFETRDSLGLDSESEWLLEQTHRRFVLAGAKLSAEARKNLMALNEELSSLETVFSQNLLAETNDLAVIVDTVEELDGLDANQISACSAAAEDRGHKGKYLIAMVNFTGNPTLAELTNRKLRKRIMEASLLKGGRDNEYDNRPILLQMVALRAKRAEILGVQTHAQQVMLDRTAGNPENVHKMLRQIAPAAAKNARAEAAELQKSIDSAGGDFQLASWDWDFYSERVRLEKYSIDTTAMKPYFELERVLRDGVFFAAEKLFGTTFSLREDLLGYHPEARVYEVNNEDGSPVGLFVADFFTRDSKRGGAWMNNLVDQNHLLGQLPIVVNNLNIPKPAIGEPALLTFDETTTLFHEFGHALHGLLSNVTYPSFSGTSVQRDFVEFPSQVNEMWMLWPEVLGNYARHIETNEPMPQAWIDNLKAADTFNEGHATSSYLQAAVLDLAWHSLTVEDALTDVEKFEVRALDDYGLAFDAVPSRYRTSYFSHIFAGGYSAGYYGYIWSEVLDADTVDWFKQNGGLTRANGQHFRQTLLSRGGSLDSMQMFRNFRGQEASIEPLLKRRGLV
jgi:peptidyl-dipeptidase Dcp